MNGLLGRLSPVFRNSTAIRRAVIWIASRTTSEERRGLVAWWLFYSVWGSAVSLCTNVIPSDQFDFDTGSYCSSYFSLNASGLAIIRHPLYKLLFLPFSSVATVIEGIAGYKAKEVLLVCLMSFSVAFSVMLVFRYLRTVAQLGRRRAWFLTVLFGSFSTNLILAFSPESYAISGSILLFSVLYYSVRIEAGRSIGVIPALAMTIAAAGVTLTNGAKTVVPLVFSNESFWHRMKKMAIVSSISLFIIFAWSFLALAVKSARHETQHSSFGLIRSDYENFGSSFSLADADYAYWALSIFWSAPLVLETAPVDLAGNTGASAEGPVVRPSSYSHWWLYVPALGLLVLCLLSLLRNFHNRLVLVAVLPLGFDIVIHLVLQWGLETAMIYGGHWVFVVPLLVGWLYQSIDNDRHRSILDWIVGALLVIVAFANGAALLGFFEFAAKHYPRL